MAFATCWSSPRPGHSTEVLQFSNEQLPPPVVRLQKLSDSDGSSDPTGETDGDASGDTDENRPDSDTQVSRRRDRKKNRSGKRKRRGDRKKSSGRDKSGQQGQKSNKDDNDKAPDTKPDNWLPDKRKSDNIDPWAN